MRRVIFIAAIITLVMIGQRVYALVGVINPFDNGNYKALILDDSSTINFGYFTTQNVYNVSVTDTELTGYIWASTFGWVNLNCANNNACASANYKVSNSNGTLSGYAWGENSGWINFGPFSNPAISQVKIASNGKFGGTLGSDGYAWSENFGWIKFDCSSGSSCVETSWVPTSGTTSSSGSTSSDGSNSGSSSSTTVTTDGSGTEGVTDTGGSTDTTGTNGSTSSDTEGTSGTSGTTSDTGTTSAETSTGEGTDTVGGTGEVTGSTEASTGTSSGTDTGGTSSGTGTIFDTIGDIVGGVVSPEIDEQIIKIVDTDPTKKIVQAVTAVGAVVNLGVSLATILFINPFSFSELILLPFRLWSLFLSALGLRRRPWGVVYDSITKQPLDPVYVSLQDMSGKEIASSITDLDGRYGFLPKAGTYKIVAGKTNYVFPSTRLTGRDHDELYHDLYFGEVITIGVDGAVIAKNIPMDPIKFDWNEFAKRDQKLMKFYHKRDRTLATVANILFIAGFFIALVALVSVPKTYNIVIFILYIVIAFMKRTGLARKSFGEISDKTTGKPLAFAVVRVYSQATKTEITHKVTTEYGRYYCLVQNGTYYITVEKKNPDATYTLLYTSAPIEVKHGVITQSVEV